MLDVNRPLATLAAGLVLVTAAAAAPPASHSRPDPDDGGRAWLTPEQRQWLDEHPRIRLGPYSNYAPAQFVDADGVHRGIAADYVHRIEQMLGIEFVEVRTRTWQELIHKARDREIDVIALIAETPDRLEYLSFTPPYLDLPAVIIARESEERRFTMDDLEGLTVVVVQDYAVQRWLEANYPQLDLETAPTTLAALQQVSLGLGDVLISDLAVATHYIERAGITNLRVVGESGFVYHMGFAARNDWPELADILTAALARITPAERLVIDHRWIELSRETEFASRRTMHVLLGVMAVVVLVAGGFVVWTWSLHRLVRQRTRALDEQLAERQRAAAALEHSEQRIRQIIATALDAVVTMDAGGLITGWSPQAERTFGWTRDEVIGRPLAETIVPETYRAQHVKGLRQFLATGDGPVLNTRVELKALHKDGHVFPVELSIAPIERDGTYEFSAFVRDVTKRREAEAELERHRHHLEELVTERTAEVLKLRDLLPICSYCHRIREGEEYTRSVEAYLAEHHDISHGVCPECYEKYVRKEIESL